MKQTHEHGGKSSEDILDKNIILQSLKFFPGQNVLDAGCGNGYMAKEFSRLVGAAGKVYAFDIHETSIKQLKKDTDGTNITAVHSDVTKRTAIEDSSIDLIYLSTVFHGFTASQIKDFLSEVKRILKPGSILAIVEINKDDTPFGPPIDIRYSPDELVEAVGLERGDLIEIGGYFYMQTFIYRD